MNLPTLTPAGYRSRVADSPIAKRLESVGAVLLEGPKGCGKSWTGLNNARSVVHLDTDMAARQLVDLSPGAVLEGGRPRLLDEWQLAPNIWNHVRHACDHSAQPGQFLLTGSAAPADDIVRHSGAGRIARVRLRPMSLSESGQSNGHVSLDALLRGKPADASSVETQFGDILNAICVGGWPWLLEARAIDAQQRLREYLDEVRHVAVSHGTTRGRNPVLMERFLISLARNTATTAPNSRIASDAGGEAPLNHQTTRAYLDTLHELFVAEDLPAWPTHLRSRSRLTQAPKRHFVDPSLAAAALRADPQALLSDLETCGFLFESLTIRDLRVYADAADCDVFHCRLDNGVEADAIIQQRFGGAWAAVEIKLSHSPETIETAAASLHRFVESFEPGHDGGPVAMVVVTARGYAYTRPDGVTVTPITALGP